MTSAPIVDCSCQILILETLLDAYLTVMTSRINSWTDQLAIKSDSRSNLSIKGRSNVLGSDHQGHNYA